MEMKLYELTEIYNTLMDLDLDDEALKSHLSNLNDDVEVKADNIAKVIAEMKGDISKLKAEEERLASKRKALENREKSLKKYLETAFIAMDIKKVKTALFSFNIQKNPASVKIEDESKVPESFFKIVKSLDKTSLKKAVQDGLEIEGVSLEQTESLRIR